MNIKIEIVSSAFENNLYPKGVACFKAKLSYNNINIELYHTFIANSLNLSDLANADNQCQNIIIKKIINTLQFINYKINNELYNKEQNLNYQQGVNYQEDYVYQKDFIYPEDYPLNKEITLNKDVLKDNKDKEINEDILNYKKRTLEIATEFGISIDKLSKISLKLNGISNLYELNNTQWQKIYNFIQQKIQKYKSKLLKENSFLDNYQEHQNYEKIENVKNKNDILKKNRNNYKGQELRRNLEENEEQDNEVILDDEWQEIL